MRCVQFEFLGWCALGFESNGHHGYVRLSKILKKNTIRTSGERNTTFETFLGLQNMTYLHSLGHIFFYKMNLEVRFVPLESRLQGLQFEHKFDPIRSSDGE